LKENLIKKLKNDFWKRRRQAMSTLKEVKKQFKKLINSYVLIIKPAIPPEDRHKIESFLEHLNYKVIGGGTMTDKGSCDISFEKEAKNGIQHAQSNEKSKGQSVIGRQRGRSSFRA
jgi:hypothetical protein